jgi:PKD repeat protein
MKKGVLVVVMLIAFVGIISASVDVSDSLIEDSYVYPENVSGFFVLDVEEVELDSNISINIDEQAMVFREFLDLNLINYASNCSTQDCFDSFNSVASGQESFDIVMNGEDKKYVGIVLQGEIEDITSFEINFSSDFVSQDELPLSFKFFNELVWDYDKVSDEYSADKFFGCYNSSLASASYSSLKVGSKAYCEKVSVPRDSKNLNVGGLISGTHAADLKLSVYDSLTNGKGSCPLEDAGSGGENECIIDGDFEKGDYYVCVNSPSGNTDFDISSESSGEKCGYFGTNFDGESSRDYGLYAQTSKYAAAESELIKSSSSLDLVGDLEQYLRDKYEYSQGVYDCSSGCVLPIEISGISQNLELKNFKMRYDEKGVGSKEVVELHEVERIPVTVDFSGKLVVDLLGFDVGTKSGEKNLIFYLDDENFFEKEIAVLVPPIIESISPENPPAGVEFEFILNVTSENKIQSYVWDFGDGEKETTDKRRIKHTYLLEDIYDVGVKVRDDEGLSSEKNFSIIAGDLESALDSRLVQSIKDLNNTREDILDFPSWYATYLSDLMGLSVFEEKIELIETEKVSANNDTEFLALLNELRNLGYPQKLFFSETLDGEILIKDLNDIDAGIVAKALNLGSGGSYENYLDEILRWQFNYISSDLEKKKVSVVRSDGGEDLINVYDLEVVSNASDEGYLVVKHPEGIVLKDSSSVLDSGENYIVVSVAPNAKKTIEFYTIGGEEPVIFVSPSLSLFSPDTGGEIHNTGKYWKKVIYWILGIVIFGLVLYTVLQVWYRLKYERFLFKDGDYLFNLVMFIDNSIRRGVSEKEVFKGLKQKGWSGEQINYALRKYHGKRTGMVEIIPIEMISSYFRNRKIEKLNQQKVNKV